MRGFAPFRPEHDAYELHVSHWSGPLPLLEVSPNWTYGGTLQGLFGRLTYRDEAVHGFRTPSATRRDPYARFVYIDTFNSVYGPGWKRDTGIVTHRAKRGVLLQLRRAGAAAGLPVERAARPRQRRAAPGEGHGPGRDADRGVGGRGPAPLQRCVGPGVQPASSTGWWVRETSSAHPSASARENPSSPSGSSLTTSTQSTRAPRGPSRAKSTSRSTASRSPSNTASTVPSGRFRAQPLTPAVCARRRVVSRKKTP